MRKEGILLGGSWQSQKIDKSRKKNEKEKESKKKQAFTDMILCATS